MKWMNYISPDKNASRVGLVEGDAVFGLRHVRRLIELLGDDGTLLRRSAELARHDPLEVFKVTDVTVLAPIPQPPSIRDFMAFEDHILPILHARGAELDPAWYEIPGFYFTNPTATLSHVEPVRMPPGASDLDYELEVAAVIGRTGSDIDPTIADSHIAGYILMSDWSARDLQRKERGIGLGPAKGKDWATSFGPYLVTPDEFEGRENQKSFDLRLTASVNGMPYSDGNLSQIYWSFAEMIAYASRGTTLIPGDVIGSGTVGTGCIADLSSRFDIERYPWLRCGDVVVLDGQELGEIRVTITEGSELIPLEDGRPRPRSQFRK